MPYTFVDYWNNGNIDVMSGEKLIAEVKTNADDLELSFSICVNFKNKAELESWLEKHISEMLSIANDSND